jgi:hypothetical protein
MLIIIVKNDYFISGRNTMNRYLMKSAVALALCLSTAARPENNNWSLFNISINSNVTRKSCDEFGCTVTKTDSKGNQTQHYYPHERNGNTTSQGQIFIDQTLRTDSNGDTYWTDDRGNRYYGQSLHVENNNGTVVNYGSHSIVFAGAEHVADKDAVVRFDKVIFSVKTGDRFQQKHNDKIRVNGQKLDVKKLSGEQVQIPTEEIAINKVGIPGWLASVHIGDESKITCDSAIAEGTVFGVKDGNLTASLGAAYKYKGEAPCKVYAKLLGDALRATDHSHVKLDKQQSVKKCAAHDYAFIEGSVRSPKDDASLQLKTDNQARIALTDEGKRKHITLSAEGQGGTSLKGVLAHELRVTGDGRGVMNVDGKVGKQNIILDSHAVYDARNLEAQKTHVKMVSHSSAILWVTKKLTGLLDGHSGITLRGNPDTSTLHRKGRHTHWRRFSEPFA